MHLRPLCIALVALSCRKAPPSAHDAMPPRATQPDAHADVAQLIADAAPIEAPHVLPRWTPPPGPPPRPDAGVARHTTTARVSPVNTDDPWALAAAPDGAFWVRAVNHPGQRTSEIVATVMGHDGVAVGPPKLVRRTTGPVRAVSVDAANGQVWIAWHTVRPAETSMREEHIVAALHGDATLTEVGAPVTLTNFSYMADSELPYVWSEPIARVFVRDDGGALVVSTGARSVCVHGESEEHTERVPCEGWNVSRVELTGEKRVSSESLLCPVGVPQGFARVPGGVAYAVREDHIGTKILTFTAAIGATAPAALPIESELWHYSDPVIAWGDGVFAMRATYIDDAQGLPTRADGVYVRGPTPSTHTPTLHDSYGGELIPGVTLSPLRCVDGHPVARVRWDRGPAAGVVFDPTHAGTSVDLARWSDTRRLALPANVEDPPEALVWAGSALVGVSGATLLRWTCAADGSLHLAGR